jgi:hypothetical protein
MDEESEARQQREAFVADALREESHNAPRQGSSENRTKRPYFFFISFALIALMTSGCVSVSRIPTSTAAAGLKTILVVPLEAPPIFLEPASEADRAAIASAGLELPTRQGRVIIVFPLFWPLPSLVGTLAVESVFLAATSKPLESESGAFVKREGDSGMTTEMLARKAAEMLQDRTSRQVLLAGGYIKLDIADRSMNVQHGIGEMENWLAPTRRWYNAEMPLFEYKQTDLGDADAVLEIGLQNYAYLQHFLSLVVSMKLIDPVTKQVLGRTRCGLFPVEGGSLAKLLDSHAEPLRNLVESIAEKHVRDCLTELGLIPHAN